MEYLNIALPKGRIGELAIDMFNKLGFKVLEDINRSRKLIFEDKEKKVRFFLVKPSDVPTYVEYGSADIGIVGKDILLEKSKNLYEILNLGFGKCKMVLAGRDKSFNDKNVLNKRVATKFPNITRHYFEHKKNESIEIIDLNGSIELAPLVGLAEYIVDIVETGSTLKENGLKIIDTITDVSARLVSNRVSFKMKNDSITKLTEDLKKTLEAKEVEFE